MRHLLPILFLGVVLVVSRAGCDDSTPADDGQVTVPDAGPTPDSAATPDTFRGPWANVYKDSPTADNRKTSEVLLTNITDPAGKLTGKFAEVWNCMPDPGGETFNFGGTSGIMCTPKQTALPGEDGSYLHIKAPASDVVGNDSFAEVMMYHHINAIHDHYTSSFGLTHLDKEAILAVTNLQYGSTTGQWTGFPNAGYTPGGGTYGSFLGLPADRDTIIFGYVNSILLGSPVNFSYDAAVIYHEYTHFTVGTTLLARAVPDKYGLSPTPLALNEGLADYFPSSFLDDSKLGAYSLGIQQRDLEADRRCPAHLRGESHNDGRIASGALWAARKLLGADVLDKAAWKAILSFAADTNFDEASAAILDEIKKVAPDKHAAVEQVFTERGFSGCVRLMAHKDFTANMFDPYASMAYPGGWGVSTTYADGVPAYVQYKIPINPTTQEVTIVYRPEKQSYYGAAGKGIVWVALKPGSEPILYDYSSGKGVSDAHAVLEPTDEGTTDSKLVISGDCIKPGEDLVFLFINKENARGSFTMVKVTQSDTKTNTTDNFTGCTP